MNNLTKEQMLELARKCTDSQWTLYEWTITSSDGQETEHFEIARTYPISIHAKGRVIWNPSLEGPDWQVAQACRVIVAASRLKYFHLMQWADGFTVEYVDGDGNEISTPVCADILTASAMALLADRGKG